MKSKNAKIFEKLLNAKGYEIEKCEYYGFEGWEVHILDTGDVLTGTTQDVLSLIDMMVYNEDEK